MISIGIIKKEKKSSNSYLPPQTFSFVHVHTHIATTIRIDFAYKVRKLTKPVLRSRWVRTRTKPIIIFMEAE